MRVTAIRMARSAQFAADTLTLKARGARIRHLFWLTQSIVVEMPLDSVVPLSGDATVRYIELTHVPADPPQIEDAVISTAVSEGRRQINSDPYFDLELDYGWVGLLDTGVGTHQLLMSEGSIDPARIASRENYCTEDGDGSFYDGDRGDGHGTQTAAILSGNESFGTESRGVTEAALDSRRVYWYEEVVEIVGGGTEITTYRSHVCVDGAERAIEDIISGALDPVLVVEIDKPSEGSALETACDNTYACGRAVIVAVGNKSGGSLDVSSPGAAHKVIAVGAYDVSDITRETWDLQRRGPTSDHRMKPDIMAPTGTETASSTPECDNEHPCEGLSHFPGTSGATPYAGGAAILWRNWLSQFETPVDPGLVYAFMILAGRETGLVDETRGAGPIRMPSDGWAWYGPVEVEAGKAQPVEIEIPWDDAYALEAAIWWPEDEGGDHSNHRLGILNPDGDEVAFCGHETSVFQRASFGDARAVDGWPDGEATTTTLTRGTWTVEIARGAAPTYDQQVYYAIAVRTRTPPSTTLLAAALEEGGSGTDSGPSAGEGDESEEPFRLLDGALLILLILMLTWFLRHRLKWVVSFVFKLKRG
jgi:hypothetical protein